MIELRTKQFLTATLGDFMDAVKCVIHGESGNEEGSSKKNSSSKKRYVYGMAGLANLFGCSIPTAQRIKASGAIDAAISQTAKTIVVDADLALDLLRLSNQKWGRKYPK